MSLKDLILPDCLKKVEDCVEAWREARRRARERIDTVRKTLRSKYPHINIINE